MGLPTRLHGDAVAIFFGAVKGFCPKCISIREWRVVREKEKFFKKCEKCGQKREISKPELDKLVAEANAKVAREKSKKKEARK